MATEMITTKDKKVQDIVEVSRRRVLTYREKELEALAHVEAELLRSARKVEQFRAKLQSAINAGSNWVPEETLMRGAAKRACIDAAQACHYYTQRKYTIRHFSTDAGKTIIK